MSSPELIPQSASGAGPSISSAHVRVTLHFVNDPTDFWDLGCAPEDWGGVGVVGQTFRLRLLQWSGPGVGTCQSLLPPKKSAKCGSEWGEGVNKLNLQLAAVLSSCQASSLKCMLGCRSDKQPYDRKCSYLFNSIVLSKAWCQIYWK